ncbi:hypothetical protein ACJX0J_006204, partial [Zea mays]
LGLPTVSSTLSLPFSLIMIRSNWERRYIIFSLRLQDWPYGQWTRDESMIDTKYPENEKQGLAVHVLQGAWKLDEVVNFPELQIKISGNIDAEGWNDESYGIEENDMILEYHSGLTSKMIGSLIITDKSDKIAGDMTYSFLKNLIDISLIEINDLLNISLGKNREEVNLNLNEIKMVEMERSVVCDSNSIVGNEVNITNAEMEYEIFDSIDKMVADLI